MNVNAVTPIQHVEPLEPLQLEQTSPVGGDGFRAALDTAISTVEGAQQNAASAVQSFLNGTGGELHTTILATQRAELQFQLFLQLRNKVVQAYQEVMRVQL